MFGLQEPGSNSEIPNSLKYVRPGNGYEPNFELMAKSDVNGFEELELYTALKDSCPGTTTVIGDPSALYYTPVSKHDLQWNFEKFLIDQNGKPVRRYGPPYLPELIRPDIEALINNGSL